MENTPAIAVLPYAHRQGRELAATPVSDLIWPLGCPDRLTGKTVADLASQDHLILFPRTITHFQPRLGISAQVSLVMGEPAVIHGKHIALLRFSYRRFYRILTFNQDLLDRLPNALLFPYGTTWVPDWRNVDCTKTRMLSLIASAKRDSTGHKLRHEIVEAVRNAGIDMDVMGGGYDPFDQKSDGLAPYRYSVVIENVQERNYFSEKLIDALLCDTVPIYWGCPNLGDFIDTGPIIECANRDDIMREIRNASETDFEQRLPSIQKLKPELETFCDFETRAAKAIRDTLGHNKA